MLTRSPNQPTGELPRKVTPNLFWTGGCLEVSYSGEIVHGHLSTYLVKGSEKSMLVDTGHPMNWQRWRRTSKRSSTAGRSTMSSRPMASFRTGHLPRV